MKSFTDLIPFENYKELVWQRLQESVESSDLWNSKVIYFASSCAFSLYWGFTHELSEFDHRMITGERLVVETTIEEGTEVSTIYCRSWMIMHGDGELLAVVCGFGGERKRT